MLARSISDREGDILLVGCTVVLLPICLVKSLSALQARKEFQKCHDIPLSLLHHLFAFVFSQYTNYVGLAAVVLSVIVVAKRSINFNSQVVAKPNNLNY